MLLSLIQGSLMYSVVKLHQVQLLIC